MPFLSGKVVFVLAGQFGVFVNDFPHKRRALTPRAAKSVKRILDAAATLFGKEGYQGSSMKAVARAAGVSKGLLHYHFNSKEHLLFEAQSAAFQRIHLRFEEKFKQGEQGMETALEGLDTLWESIRELQTWAPFMVQTMSLTSKAGTVKGLVDAFYTDSMALLTSGIEKAFRGRLDQLIVPPERLAWMVRATLHGLVIELAYASTPTELERIDQVYQDMRLAFSHFAITATPGGH
jgi:AcrR family transcriptional regulator